MERDNTHFRYSWQLACHGRLELLWCEVHPATSHLLCIFHEHELHGVLIGAGATHHGDDVVSACWSYLHENISESVWPVVTRKHSQSWSVDKRVKHLLSSSSSKQSWVVVAQRYTGDVGEYVQHLI